MRRQAPVLVPEVRLCGAFECEPSQLPGSTWSDTGHLTSLAHYPNTRGTRIYSTTKDV